MPLRWRHVAAALLLAAGSPRAGAPPTSAWEDCGEDLAPGPFKVAQLTNATWQGTLFYILAPQTDAGALYPVLVFMHGLAAKFEMYERNLELYASHGFFVLFPFIRDPVADQSRSTTNSDGEYIVRAVGFARAAAADPQSPLYERVDPMSVAIAGHSMGATCVIAAARRLPRFAARVAIAQHPGVCGPFGPPPWPYTWMPADLAEAAGKLPVLVTTAANDDAFWPAPGTAEHELGCFNKAVSQPPVPGTGFLEFTAEACGEDNTSSAWPVSGHNCPLKAATETIWVLRAIKLYAQLEGDPTSRCHALLWGEGPGSVRNTSTVGLFVLHEPGGQPSRAEVVV